MTVPPTREWASHAYNTPSLWMYANGLRQRFEEAEHRNDSNKVPLALSVIIFSALIIETFLNELENLASGGGGKDVNPDDVTRGLADALGEVEESRGSIRLKLLTVGVALGKPIKKGEDLYQRFNLLFKVRDAIVHLKPYAYTVTDGRVDMAQAKLLDELYARSLIRNPRVLPVLGLLSALPTLAMCQWSLDTANRVVSHVVGLLPENVFGKLTTMIMAEIIGVDFKTAAEQFVLAYQRSTSK